MPTQRLTIFLLRDVKTFDDALDEEALANVEVRELLQESGLVGRFYSKSSAPHEPTWADYLRPAIDGDLPTLRAASTTGLLVIQVDDFTYALTFGHGRSLLNQARIERRFGLKVALNLVDERQLRSLDTKKFDEMVVSTNTQTSRTTELPAFGIDVMRDILRAVTGLAPNDSGFKSVSGSDALVISVADAITDLPALLRTIHSTYADTRYQISFGWVDHLTEVRDPTLVTRLDAQLLEHLNTGDTTRTHMAMPENLEWEDIEYFEVTPTRPSQYLELDLDDYLADIPSSRATTTTVDQLKHRKVWVKFHNSAEPVARWSVYHCLVSEQRIHGGLFALVEGRWFAIADALVAQVDASISALPTASIALPTGRPGESEADYNARAATESPDLALLDRQLVAPDGSNTKIEFCDLLGTNGALVHVKRKTRSSTLSHLFAQGHVSAESLIDISLREQVRDVIRRVADGEAARWLELIPGGDSPLARERITIIYAVIANSAATGVEWLPFFSRLTLMQTVRDLNRLGFRNVELVRVPVEDAPGIAGP